MDINILRFETIESTNSEAIKQAKRGAKEGVCVFAREQTAGRGRHGNTWASAKDSGLYFSIILRPKIELKFLPLITLMSAVAVHDTLKQQFELNADIKWSNDLLINEKKICGILAETAETKTGIAVIVGIGINLTSKGFPHEISKTATSIEEELTRMPDVEDLLSSLIQFISYFYDIFESANGSEVVRAEWAKRSSYFEGKQISAILGGEKIYGTTCGLEENGALRVKSEDGKVIVLQAGEVNAVRQNHN